MFLLNSKRTTQPEANAMTTQQAIEFVRGLEHSSPCSENLKASAFGLQSVSNRARLDVLLEELDNFNWSRASAETKSSAAEKIARTLSEMLRDEVRQWEQFDEWQRECSRPCDMTAYHDKRDSAA